MTLISEEYRALNTKLHQDNKLFGSKGHKRGTQVFYRFIEPYNVTSCLDYGCGKGTLAMAIKDRFNFDIQCYDPSYLEFNNHPAPRTFDGVICNDVLEHIEPELLDNVLHDLYNLGQRVFHLEIGLCESNKTLADGRNAHLIIESSKWWKERLEAHGFHILETLETEADSTNPLIVFYTVIAIKKELL